MTDYIKKHQISPEDEQKVLLYIETCVKINPTGVINWYKMTDVVCMEKVSENDFQLKMQEMVQNLGANIQNTYYIVQADNLHPPLLTKLEDYFAHLSELLYHDPIFLAEDLSHIIHYDFYGDLWGKLLLR